MMKNKFVKYLLGGLMLVVWGTIIYRIVSTVNASEPQQSLVKQISATTTPIPSTERYILVNTYADPFIKDEQVETDSIKLPATTSFQPNILPPPPNVNFIQYLGMISNLDKRTRAALISIRGQDRMVRERDTTEGVCIKKILEKEIHVSYSAHEFIIKKQ